MKKMTEKQFKKLFQMAGTKKFMCCPECGAYIDYEQSGVEGFDLADLDEYDLDEEFDLFVYECECGEIFWANKQ